MLINRICFVCGKEHSDVHHINGSTIGMGGNRKKVDHTGRYVICLCREHHGTIHEGLEKEFFEKHHVVPIKLHEDDLKQLNL